MRVQIGPIGIDQLHFTEAVEKIATLRNSDKASYVVTANPEMVVEASRNTRFAEVVRNADIVVADGVGLLAGSSFLSLVANKHYPFLIRLWLFVVQLVMLVLKRSRASAVLPKVIPGVDLMQALVKYAAQHTIPVALIGGTQAQVKGTEEALRQWYPSLKLITDPGPPDVTQESTEDFASLRAKLEQVRGGFVFVAFGHPKQELWIANHLSQLPPCVAMGVGGAFAYISQSTSRANGKVRKAGFEWLWRLVTEPKRLRRIITAVVVYPWYLVTITGAK